MNVYQKCEHCRQYLNTDMTAHYVVKQVDGSTAYLHTVPCYRQYSYENEHVVLQHNIVRRRA